jgi:hypothetical protein
MARKGAEHRYEELTTEIALLVKNFPHLARSAAKSASRVISRGVAAAETEAPKVRRARKMSAAARKAVSTRMKKYWAARRSAKSKGK